jgi:hypothetical protein
MYVAHHLSMTKKETPTTDTNILYAPHYGVIKVLWVAGDSISSPWLEPVDVVYTTKYTTAALMNL